MRQVTLCAQSAGYLFPLSTSQVLRVHSVFARAINLRTEEGSLITLLCAQTYQNLPDALRVTLPAHWDWRHAGTVADTFHVAHGRLQTRCFSVEMSTATIWQPLIKGNSLALEMFPITQRHFSTLASQLLLFCLEHKVESALCWQGRESVYHGLQPQEQPEQFERQVPQLMGYGKGLTPDGDDYLLGYLAALWPWQLSAPLANHYHRLQQSITQYLHHTTDISRHYLSRAVHGHFSQPICHLLEQLAQNASPTTIIACAEDVMQFGATSGVDCLAGFLHGMRTLNTTF